MQNVLKFCCFILEIPGPRVPSPDIKDFTLFNIGSKYRFCLSAGCISVASVILQPTLTENSL